VFSCAATGLRLRRRETSIAVVLSTILALGYAGMAFADTPPPTTAQEATTPTPTITTTTLTDAATTSVAMTTTAQASTAGSATATLPTAATATTSTAPASAAACAGAGMLLLLLPSRAPRIVGPAVSARAPAGEGATTFRYPADGSVLRGVSARADISGCRMGSEPETATSTLRRLNLFGGAVRAERLTATLVHAPTGSGWHLRVFARGLLVEGRRVSPRLDRSLRVGSWGRLLLDGAHVDRSSPGGLAWWRAGLELRLTKAHAGLAPGTELLIAYVAADRPFTVVAGKPSGGRSRAGGRIRIGGPAGPQPALVSLR
jgi:hypothetical protein